MNAIPFVDIHTHPCHTETNTVTVQNIYPGDGFGAFTGRNFYSVGLHPWHILSKEENNLALKMVEDALEFDHVILVGEAGLDKKTTTDFAEQQRVFEAQAYLAEEYQYPLIIHCIKAFNEVLEMQKRMNPNMPWVMHGYNGSLELTKQLLGHNFLFSFGGSLFRKKSKGIDSFKYIPMDLLFFETDESDEEVSKVYEQGARIKGISEIVLKTEVWKNFNRIEKSLTSNY